MDIRTLERDRKYRHSLGRNIGKRARVHCSNFEVREREDGKRFLLLIEPKVVKIERKCGRQKYPIRLGHLWVELPKGFESCLAVARKIEVVGTIKEYPYIDRGTKQVGITASKARVVKYKKEIAKQYKLNPYDQLPGHIF